MSTKDFSSVQEKNIADSLGWDVVSGSGSRHLSPGDVISDKWLGECKTHVTPGQMIAFLESVWEKLQEEADSRFKFPVLFVDDGSQDLEKTWCMMRFAPMSDYMELDPPSSVRSFDSSVSFKHDIVYRIHKSNYSKYNSPILYRLEVSGKPVYITHFFDFRELLGVY